MSRRKWLVCGNNRDRADISYHRFPKDVSYKNVWSGTLKLSSDMVTSHAKICSAHFSKEIIVIAGKKFLSANAIPFLSSVSPSKIEEIYHKYGKFALSDEEMIKGLVFSLLENKPKK